MILSGDSAFRRTNDYCFNAHVEMERNDKCFKTLLQIIMMHSDSSSSFTVVTRKLASMVPYFSEV
jgi:hypothetical protein